MKLKLCTVLLAAATVFTASSVFAQKAPSPAGAKAAAAEGFAKLPLSFEPTGDPARFLAHSGTYSVSVGAREAAVAVMDAKSGKSQTLRFGFDHANSAATPQAIEPLSGVTNYYLGDDPAKWRLGVKNYAKVRAEGIYPGVDVVYYGDHRRLEFDFVVAPKADPRAIALSFAGMEKLYKDASGDLVADINGQSVRFAKPFAYQRIAGAIKPVPVEYEMASADSVRLHLGSYDAKAELVIDPVVTFLTYLGGTSTDQVNGVAVDSSGDVYVTGTTSSTDFPDGAILVGSSDAFVTKYNAAGTAYVYTTIIGGTAPEGATASGNAIALDENNQAYITGTTNFTNIPGNVNYGNGLNTYQGGDSDAYVVILTSTGALLRSTYLGGAGPDAGLGIAVDSKSSLSATYHDTVIVVGQTRTELAPAVAFPGYNAFETAIEEYTAFVTKLDNNLHICAEPNNGASVMTPMVTGATPCFFSLTFGGQPVAPFPTASWVALTPYPLYAIIEDSENPPNIQIVINSGVTGGSIGTALNPWNSAINGTTTDGSVTWLNLGPALVRPPYATSQANAVALDPHGDIFVAGGTDTANLGATIDSFGPFSHYVGTGAWVLKVGGIAGDHLYGAALENTASDLSATINTARAIAVDPFGKAYVVGTASGTLFTTAGAYAPGFSGGADDAFLVRINTAGSGLEYSTYLGGSGNDQGLGVAVDSSGAAYVTGSTQSTNFPTINPLDDPNSVPVANSPVLALNGAQDAFVSKFTTDGSALIFSTYLGGSGIDQGNAIAVDTSNQGNMYVAGSTYSADLLQLDPAGYNAPQLNYGGGGDGFLAMIAGASLPTVTVTPGSLSFGIQDEFVSSTPVAVQYTNANTISSVTVSNILFGGTNPGDFYQVFPAGIPGNCSDSGVVSVSSACDVWVVFNPQGPGARSATLTITDNTSSTAHVISLTGTGAVPEDSFSQVSLTFLAQLVNTTSAAQTITLQDTGQGPLNISSIAVSGTNAGDFSESNNCPAQLGSGNSCTITVVFTPAALGTRTALLTVTDNGSGSPHPIALTGSAIAVGNTITPTVSFGQQAVGSSASMPVVIKNTDQNNQTLVISGVSISSGSFSIGSNPCVTSLAPGASCTLQVTFTPATAANLTGTLTVSGNGSGMPASVALSGTGVAGSGGILLPTSLAFTTAGTESMLLVNNSTTALSLGAFTIGGTNAADFAISTSTSGTPCVANATVLAAGKSCSIAVTLTPSTNGAESAWLSVAGSASNSPQKVTLIYSPGTGSTTGMVVTPSATGVSVTQGNTANFTLSIAPNGTTGKVNFTCAVSTVGSTTPLSAGCAFSPSSVTLDGSTTTTVQLTVSTNAHSASANPARMGIRSIFLAVLPFSMMGMLLVGKRRRVWGILILVVLCLLMMGLVSCGSGSGSSSTSSSSLSPGAYQVSVYATPAGASVSSTPTLSLNLVVNVQ